MLVYARALRMFRETGRNTLDLPDGVRIERANARVFVYNCGYVIMAIREGSVFEFFLDGAERQPGYEKAIKKHGPNIGIHVSKRGYWAFRGGILRNGMLFEKTGRVLNDVSPESSVLYAENPCDGDADYDCTIGNDDEQPNNTEPASAVPSNFTMDF